MSRTPTASAPQGASAPPKKAGALKGLRKHLHTYGLLHIMALPTVICLILFAYAPMFGLVMAFQDFNVSKGFFGSDFVGFKNFEFLFATSDAWTITRNTVLYNVAFIILGNVCAVVLSVMLSEMYFTKTGKVLQTIFIMPNFLSIAVIAIIVFAFLSPTTGYLNSLLKASGQPIVSWYTTPDIWPPLLIFVNLWKGTGYSAVVYLATISGISNEYYEAAMLDGATKLQQIRYITIPNLRFIITIQLIMAVGSMFRGDIGLFYTVTMNNGALYPVTDVIDTYVFRALTKMNNPGMATAAGLYQSIVGLILILISNKIVTKVDPDSALF